MHLTKKFVGLKSKNTSYILWTKLGNYGHSGEEGVESSAAPIPLVQNISWDDAGPGRKLEKRVGTFHELFSLFPQIILEISYLFIFYIPASQLSRKKNR